MTKDTGTRIGLSAFPLNTFTSDKTVEYAVTTLNSEELKAAELLCLTNVLGKPRGGVPGYPSRQRAESIGEKLQELSISIHGPYTISLTTTEASQIRHARAHMTMCLRLADAIGATHVTFHPGSRRGGQTTIRRLQKRLKEIMTKREEERIGAMPAPEVAGKVASLGSFEEICSIAGEVGCLFCWDFAHDFARGGNVTTETGLLQRLEMIEKNIDLASFRLPIHISGIIAGRRGEIQHAPLDGGNQVPWRLFLSVLLEQHFLDKVVIICESKSSKSDNFDYRVGETLKLKAFIESGKLDKNYQPTRPLLSDYFSETADDDLKKLDTP